MPDNKRTIRSARYFLRGVAYDIDDNFSNTATLSLIRQEANGLGIYPTYFPTLHPPNYTHPAFADNPAWLGWVVRPIIDDERV